jgi:hypothetical protein
MTADFLDHLLKTERLRRLIDDDVQYIAGEEKEGRSAKGTQKVLLGYRRQLARIDKWLLDHEDQVHRERYWHEPIPLGNPQ